MKVYSIGREVGCDIVINDSSDVISRRHAILNVLPSGKMTIVDQSHNGTYVNGIKISPNVPVPVTRKDNISFAHVARLDWNRIPKSNSITQYIICGVVAVVLLAGAGVAGYYFLKPEPAPVQKTESTSPEPKKEEAAPDKEEEKKEDPEKVKEEEKKEDSASDKEEKKETEKKQPKADKNKAKGANKDKKKKEDKSKEDNKSKTEKVSAGARH